MEGDEIMNGEVLKLLVSKKEVKLLVNEVHHAGNVIKHTRQKNF